MLLNIDGAGGNRGVEMSRLPAGDIPLSDLVRMLDDVLAGDTGGRALGNTAGDAADIWLVT